jgi:hypothetical protein
MIGLGRLGRLSCGLLIGNGMVIGFLYDDVFLVFVALVMVSLGFCIFLFIQNYDMENMTHFPKYITKQK